MLNVIGQRQSHLPKACIFEREKLLSVIFNWAANMDELFPSFLHYVLIFLLALLLPEVNRMMVFEDKFSSARAWNHTKALVDLGPRMMGSRESEEMAVQLISDR